MLASEISKEPIGGLHFEKGLGNIQADELQAELAALDTELEAELRRKFDRRILPVVTLIYLMAFIDRSVQSIQPTISAKQRGKNSNNWRVWADMQWHKQE